MIVPTSSIDICLIAVHSRICLAALFPSCAPSIVTVHSLHVLHLPPPPPSQPLAWTSSIICLSLFQFSVPLLLLFPFFEPPPPSPQPAVVHSRELDYTLNHSRKSVLSVRCCLKTTVSEGSVSIHIGSVLVHLRLRGQRSGL